MTVKKSNPCTPKSVHLENYKEIISREAERVLLAVISYDSDYPEYQNLLAGIAAQYDTCLKVCLVSEDSRKAIMKNFNIFGTPTFVLFDCGREIDRILGKVNFNALNTFINKNMMNN